MVGLAVVVALAGCSDSTQEPAPPGNSTYLPAPAGVTLTAQGTELSVGNPGVVAWQVKPGKTSVLQVTVRRLERAKLSALNEYDLSKRAMNSSLFFVRARVKNVGDTNLGGQPVPLYAVDGKTNALVEATTFVDRFEACPSATLPRAFGKGAQSSVCLVYLVPDHGTLDAVSFRPNQAFDPITWAGRVTDAPRAKPHQPKKDEKHHKPKQRKKPAKLPKPGQQKPQSKG